MLVCRIAAVALSVDLLLFAQALRRDSKKTQIASSSNISAGSECGWTQKPKDVNPFLGETLYVNPSYKYLLQGSIDITDGYVKQTMQKMQNVPSAFWIDIKSKIYKSDMHPDLSTVEGILEDAAQCDPPHLVTFIVYDLPNRDCFALASNGEICCHYGENVGRTGCEMGWNGFYKEYPGAQCADGLNEYMTTYIDPFAEVVKRFDGIVPIVLIIEPDSLPNQATNQGNRGCHEETQIAYEEGIKYAVQKFSETNAVMYLDAAHGGWLGWIQDAESFAAQVSRMGVAPYLRGFATNTANYQATGIATCPTLGLCRGGQGGNATCCQEDPCSLQGQYNYGHDEVNYIDMMDSVMQAAIPGFRPYFVIDTGRNGAPGSRGDCSHWCNPRGSGIGHVPSTDTPDPRIDAFHWLKTPGESDGCTEDLPEGGKCPRFDRECASADSIGSGAGEPRAPEAGLWFHFQIADLAANADLGDTWWVDLYNSGMLQCRAPDGGCATPMPPSGAPLEPTPSPPRRRSAPAPPSPPRRRGAPAPPSPPRRRGAPAPPSPPRRRGAPAPPTPPRRRAAPAPPRRRAPAPPSPGGSCSAVYDQCGGIGWSGPTCCANGATCTVQNEYYSQCL